MGALCCCFAATKEDNVQTKLTRVKPAYNVQSPAVPPEEGWEMAYKNAEPIEDSWMISCEGCQTKLMKQYPTTTCVQCGKKMDTNEVPTMS